MGDLLLVFMSPLAGYFDRYAAGFVYIAHTCLRLQVSVLLVWQMIVALNNHIGCCPADLHVARPDLVMLADVAFEFGIEDGGIFHRFHGIGDPRQI